MNAFEQLLSSTGTWHGLNRLWLSPDDPPDESASTLDVIAVLGGRFIRIDQTWAYGGRPQSGSLLLGFDAATNAASAHWIDTFHMGNKVLACTGTATENGVFDVRGSYAAPPGPDWGWRIQIELEPSGALVLLMHNIHPDGKQELAVEARHTRVAPGK